MLVFCACVMEDVVDHRIDDRLGMEAQQEFQDADVGSGEASRLRKTAKAPGSEIASCPLRRPSIRAQGGCGGVPLGSGAAL